MITIAPNVLGPLTSSSTVSETLIGSGGAAPYSFALLSGTLPTGVGLASDGTLSGIPTGTGTYSFTIRATDNLGYSGDQPYIVQVRPPLYWYICTRSTDTPAIPPVAPNQLDHNRKVANALDSLTKSRHEVGDLQPRPILKSIRDHLLCDGTAVSRSSFPQLFAEIGTSWGEGDGSATFNIPDLIGAALPIALSAPPQVISSGATVSSGEPVTAPTTPSQTGGSIGGNVGTGGRYQIDNPIPIP